MLIGQLAFVSFLISEKSSYEDTIAVGGAVAEWSKAAFERENKR